MQCIAHENDGIESFALTHAFLTSPSNPSMNFYFLFFFFFSLYQNASVPGDSSFAAEIYHALA